jgi:RNA polymerase sigma factor (sigma-70 family)
MSPPSPFDSWVQKLLTEGEALGALVLFYVNRGEAPERARDLAEDAIQEALSRVLTRELRSYVDYKHFRNAIIVTAKNHAISKHRKQRRERPLPDEGDCLAAPEEGLGQRSELVRQCLDQFPEAERRLLELHYYEEYTLDQLADLLLPADGRTANARRLEMWRRLRGVLRQFRELLLANGLVLAGEMVRHDSAS